MTVTYTAEVATCRGLGCFLKLLKRWKGSIYKLVWMDLIIFLLIYYGLSFIYRFGLDDTGKELFESVVKYCREYSNLIPLSFVLGFYVSIVMTRWWNQYTAIPFPDPLAVYVSATVHGQDERGRVMRRTIMRYACLSVTMLFAMISPKVKRKFPTLDSLVQSKLMQESEKDVFTELNKKFPNHSKHWLPLIWAASIITRARREGRIRDDFAVKTMLDELNKFRGQCGLLLSYDMISVPLVYTQVVTLAVYSYFLTTLMGQQWVEDNEYKFDLYFPIFTTLQFFFYVGWLKVAESLINPFGDDDDDFEILWMVERNLIVSYLIVDEMHHQHPELVKDQYWDEVLPQQLLQPGSITNESHPLPSTANIQVHPKIESDLIGPSSLKDDIMMNDMQNGPIMFSAKPTRGNSQTSMGNSVPDSRPMSRAGSVTNMLKRLLSREDKPKSEESQELTQVNVKIPGSIKKLADEVIEEVDEQTTITSQRSARETRPSVLGWFVPPPPSEPISVPNSSGNNHSFRSVYDPFPLSSSAPVTQEDFKDATDNVSISSSSSSEKDEFQELKKKRDDERLSRLKLNLLRGVSTAPATPMEGGSEYDILLEKNDSIESPAPRSPASVV